MHPRWKWCMTPFIVHMKTQKSTDDFSVLHCLFLPASFCIHSRNQTSHDFLHKTFHILVFFCEQFNVSTGGNVFNKSSQPRPFWAREGAGIPVTPCPAHLLVRFLSIQNFWWFLPPKTIHSMASKSDFYDFKNLMILPKKEHNISCRDCRDTVGVPRNAEISKLHHLDCKVLVLFYSACSPQTGLPSPSKLSL